MAAIVWVLPFWVAVVRASASPQWRDDLSLIRDIELVGTGPGGALSTLVTQALTLLPLGPLPFRASLASALALSIAARLLYSLALRLFDAVDLGPSSRLAAVLAGIAALAAALGPAWQREATVGGGAMIATALSLLVISSAARVAMPDRSDPDVASGGPSAPGRVLITGFVAGGALVAESPLAGLVACATGALLIAARGWTQKRPSLLAPRRTLWVGLVGAAWIATLLVLPVVLRPIAPGTVLDLGHPWSPELLGGSDIAAAETSALSAWFRDVGAVSLACALLGVVASAVRPSSRLVAGSLLLPLAADVVWPARTASIMVTDTAMPIRALALGVLLLFSAVGVYAAISTLVRLKIPMARTAAVLFVAFHLSMIALASEEAGVVADRSASFGAQEWADVALDNLEPGAAILVRDPVLVWRLWAEQRISGARPDVAIIPVPMLGRGRMAAAVVGADRSIEPLLRTYALTGDPGEYELSNLADVRPLHVEFDPKWSRELTSHLVVDGLWLEYAPQPLGSSDRVENTKISLEPIGRVLAAVDPAIGPDPSTAALVAGSLRAQATVLSRVGDTKTAAVFLDRMGELTHTDPFAARTSPFYALAGLDLKLAVLHRQSDSP